MENVNHQQPTVSVIVVSYNTADLLVQCMDALAQQGGVRLNATVVDNASDDGSADAVRKHHPWATVIANTENAGFAKANNQVIRSATEDFIVFLNPDTRLQPGALEAMAQFMAHNPRTGLAGGRLVYPDGTHQESVEYRYPGQRYTGGRLDTLPGKIAWVMGAFMIVRNAVIHDVGGFDERYFLYGEDIDLCLSIRKRGWMIGYIDNAVAVHWGGQSERNTESGILAEKKFRAEIKFYEKHYTDEEIRRIKKKTRRQAMWRIATLSAWLAFKPGDKNAADKRGRYRLALKCFS